MQRAPTDGEQLRAEPLVERPGDEGDAGEGGEEGEHAQAGLQRRVAELVLHELGQVEQRREEGRRHHQDRQARGAEALVGHHGAWDEGAEPGTSLDRQEGR